MKIISTAGESGFNPGDEVMNLYPLFFTMKDSMRTKVCNKCFLEAELQSCPKCNFHYHCSPNCLLIGGIHMLEECIYMIRFKSNFFHLRHAAYKIFQMTQTARLESLRNLVKNFAFIGIEPAQQYALFKIHNRLFMNKGKKHIDDAMECIKSFTQNRKEPTELKLIEQVLRLYYFNKISIKKIVSNQIQIVSYGLYIDTTTMSHSCIPNCTLWFNNNLLSVIALTEIKQNQHLTISLVDIFGNNSTRNMRLRDDHHCICQCYRCKLDRDLIELDDQWLGYHARKGRITDYDKSNLLLYLDFFKIFIQTLGYDKVSPEQLYPQPIYFDKLEELIAEKRSRFHQAGKWFIGRLARILPGAGCTSRCFRAKDRR